MIGVTLKTAAFALALALALAACTPRGDVVVLDASRAFDGAAVIDDARIVIENGRIKAFGPQDAVAAPRGARVVDLGDGFVMPGLIAAHSHVGMVSGVEQGGRFYTRETVARDLAQFQRYGVVAVNALGINRASVFHDLRNEWREGDHGGADLYGAGPGIGAPGGNPPAAGMGVMADQAYRPVTAEQARAAVRAMAEAGVDMIKLWLEGGGDTPRMAPEVYAAAIEEAHAHNLRVAVHIRALEDAKAALRAGADIIAHGVRDAPVDQDFIDLMLARDAWYIPTIQIDEANYVYAEHPEWLEDGFFRAALSPEFAARMQDEAWRAQALANAAGSRASVAMNIANLRALHAAGVGIGFGADSGATPVRIPGFAEHRELELMVQAGLSPAEALIAATSNAAAMMGLEDRGVLRIGARADFLVLEADPTADIGATRTLREVWRNGAPVVTIQTLQRVN